MQPEYDFSKGERGKFYKPNVVLHLPAYCDPNEEPPARALAEELEHSADELTNDLDEDEWLQAAAHNPAFDFLKDVAEDIYAPTDGAPFRDQ